MKTSEENKNIIKALVSSQTEFQTVKKDRENPFAESRYATLDAILEEILPKLNKHGILLTQEPTMEDEGGSIKIGVETTLFHETGEWITYSPFYMGLEKGSKMNMAQSAGSIITYAKRYAVSAIFGISTDEDKDGIQPIGTNKNNYNNDAKKGNGKSQSKKNQTKESSLKIKLSFGKHKGKTLGELFEEDISYINWLKGNEKTDLEIKDAIALIEKPETSTPVENNKKEQTIPSKTVQQLNDEIQEALSEISMQGGDIKATQRLYLSTSGLENFDNYNKADFLDFLEEVLSDMHIKQGELMKNGTTTANNVIDWGKTK